MFFNWSFGGSLRFLSYVVAAFLVVLLKLPEFSQGSSMHFMESGIAFRPFYGLPHYALVAFSIVLIVAQLILINNIFIVLKFFQTNHYFYSIAYLILIFQVPVWHMFGPGLIVNMLIIWMLYDLIQLYSGTTSIKYIFNLGLKSCIAFLFYPPAIILFPAFGLGILFVSRLSIRLLLIYLIAAFTPIYIGFSIAFLIDKTDVFLNGIIPVTTYKHPRFPNNDLYSFISMGVVIFTAIAGLLFMPKVFKFAKIQTKAYISSFISITVLLVLGGIYYPCFNLQLIGTVVPVLCFLTGTFYYSISKNLILELLLWAQLAIIVTIKIIPVLTF